MTKKRKAGGISCVTDNDSPSQQQARCCAPKRRATNSRRRACSTPPKRVSIGPSVTLPGSPGASTVGSPLTPSSPSSAESPTPSPSGSASSSGSASASASVSRTQRPMRLKKVLGYFGGTQKRLPVTNAIKQARASRHRPGGVMELGISISAEVGDNRASRSVFIPDPQVFGADGRFLIRHTQKEIHDLQRASNDAEKEPKTDYNRWTIIPCHGNLWIGVVRQNTGTGVLPYVYIENVDPKISAGEMRLTVSTKNNDDTWEQSSIAIPPLMIHEGKIWPILGGDAVQSHEPSPTPTITTDTTQETQEPPQQNQHPPLSTPQQIVNENNFTPLPLQSMFAPNSYEYYNTTITTTPQQPPSTTTSTSTSTSTTPTPIPTTTTTPGPQEPTWGPPSQSQEEPSRNDYLSMSGQEASETEGTIWGLPSFTGSELSLQSVAAADGAFSDPMFSPLPLVPQADWFQDFPFPQPYFDVVPRPPSPIGLDESHPFLD